MGEQKDKRYSEVYGFMEELKHVPKAARVSESELAKNVSHIKKNLAKLKKDIDVFGKTKASTDKFAKKFSAFHDRANESYSLLEDMHNNMSKLYQEIAELLSFDPGKKGLEDFFQEMNAFREDY